MPRGCLRPSAPSGPMPPVTEPLVPMVPPANAAPVTTASQIFAGPYPGAADGAGDRPAHRTAACSPTDTGRRWLMLTRFVRNQLIIFTIASIVGVAVMVFTYMQVPTLLGIGRINVTLELPSAGGLYRFSNVTYRGVQVGKVREVKLTEKGAEATADVGHLAEDPRGSAGRRSSASRLSASSTSICARVPIPARTCEDGSVIAMDNTTIPQQVGPMLDQVSALVNSIPKDRISDLLDESFKAFNGAGDDFQSLLDSSANITDYLNDVSDQTPSADR